MMTHRGSCFCGAVEIAVSGEPAGMGYCHCSSCRSWSAAPVNGFTLWPLGAVEVLKGAGLIETFNKTDRSFRKWCKSCGGHLMTEHPHWKLIDVYSAVLHNFEFKPGLHVHYAETVLPMKDGLPKLKDLPTAMGGTGEEVPE
jgi:hypothetical protein